MCGITSNKRPLTDKKNSMTSEGYWKDNRLTQITSSYDEQCSFARTSANQW